MYTKARVVALPLSIQKLAVATVSLPLFGFCFCIVWSFLYNYENSTYTHCEVDNFAPSISAAIGSFVPQKYVWQICVSLHIAPRFLYLYLYRNLFHTRLTGTPITSRLIWLATLANLTELLALLGLTIVSSLEDFDIHKVCFTVFGATSFIYICITNYLFRFTDYAPQNRLEASSLYYKRSILYLYFTAGLFMSFFYYRHNEYCEPYVYSWFCMCEYTLVLSNMAYHMTAYYDLADVTLTLHSSLAHSSSGEYAPLRNVEAKP